MARLVSCSFCANKTVPCNMVIPPCVSSLKIPAVALLRAAQIDKGMAQKRTANAQARQGQRFLAQAAAQASHMMMALGGASARGSAAKPKAKPAAGACQQILRD